jgi:hypothetical protein
LDEHNPYEAPRSAMTSSLPAGNANRRAGKLTYGAWAFVFAINLAVPLLFSASFTQEHGKRGMLLAVLSLLTLGCYFCMSGRKLTTALIVGGAVVGLTQFFPAIQIIAGLMGMGLGKVLGLTDLGDEVHPPRVNSEYGGFVVTFVTGGILMAASACAGLLIRLITPARWWQKL